MRGTQEFDLCENRTATGYADDVTSITLGLVVEITIREEPVTAMVTVNNVQQIMGTPIMKKALKSDTREDMRIWKAAKEVTAATATMMFAGILVLALAYNALDDI